MAKGIAAIGFTVAVNVLVRSVGLSITVHIVIKTIDYAISVDIRVGDVGYSIAVLVRAISGIIRVGAVFDLVQITSAIAVAVPQ